VEKEFTQDDLVEMAKETLSFLKGKVGDDIHIVGVIIDEARNQNDIGKILKSRKRLGL